MIAITDLAPNGLRFEGLTVTEVIAVLGATADIVPRDGPETSVPADEPDSPVRAQGRVTWGPGFIAFDNLSPEDAEQITAAFRRLQGGPG